MEHIAQEKIEAYARQQLDATDLLSVSDHFSQCEVCKQRLERLSADTSFFAIRSAVLDDEAPVHLTSEEMAAFVDRTLSGDELQFAVDHLAICELCTLEVNDLRSFRNEVASSLDREFRPEEVAPTKESWWQRAGSQLRGFGISPVPAFAAAFAVVLLGVIGWLVLSSQWERSTQQQAVVEPPSSSQPSPAASQQPTPIADQTATIVAQLKDGEGELKLDDKGNLEGADNLPAAYKDRLRRAISSQRVDKSSQLEGLTRPPSSLMSSDQQAGSFSVIEPGGEVLMTTQPNFRWTRMTAATGYVVEIYDDKFQLVLSSPQLTNTSWTAQQPLARGKVYSWQVKAIKDGEEVISPRPPAPQARFRVLDQATANDLSKAKQSYSSSHLMLALLYAEAGLLKEAEQELRQLQKANPGSDLPRKLLRQVQSMRR